MLDGSVRHTGPNGLAEGEEICLGPSEWKGLSFGAFFINLAVRIGGVDIGRGTCCRHEQVFAGRCVGSTLECWQRVFVASPAIVTSDVG